MKSLELSPLQTIYNNISIVLDYSEKQSVIIGDQIKERIMTLIADEGNYKNIELQPEHVEKAVLLIKAMTSFDHGDSNSMLEYYNYNAALRFMYLDPKIEKGNKNLNVVYSRMAFLQDEPFQYFIESAKTELDSLLLLWGELYDNLHSEILQDCYYLNKSALPIRGVTCFKPEGENIRGIDESDWLKVA